MIGRKLQSVRMVEYLHEPRHRASPSGIDALYYVSGTHVVSYAHIVAALISASVWACCRFSTALSTSQYRAGGVLHILVTGPFVAKERGTNDAHVHQVCSKSFAMTPLYIL